MFTARLPVTAWPTAWSMAAPTWRPVIYCILEGSWDEGPLMKGVRSGLLAPWEFSLVTVVIWGVISEAAGY